MGAGSLGCLGPRWLMKCGCGSLDAQDASEEARVPVPQAVKWSRLTLVHVRTGGRGLLARELVDLVRRGARDEGTRCFY